MVLLANQTVAFVRDNVTTSGPETVPTGWVVGQAGLRVLITDVSADKYAGGGTGWRHCGIGRSHSTPISPSTRHQADWSGTVITSGGYHLPRPG